MKAIHKLTGLIAVYLLIASSSCNLTKKASKTTTKVEMTCNDSISYSTSIKAIFDARCTGCHSGYKPAYGIDLTTYESASKIAAHRLMCVVTSGDNCNQMPPGGARLTSDEIQQINCWLDNGVKN
jgi:uncharacterized membrane protein